MARVARLLHVVLVPLLAVLTLPIAVLAGLFFGLFEAAVAFVLVGSLVPVTAILANALGDGHPASHLADDEPADSATAGEDPVEVLRDRYARGEIDEAELERRLDALLELEDVDDEAAVERTRDRLDAGDVELERE